MQIRFIKLTLATLISTSIALPPLLAVAADPAPARVPITPSAASAQTNQSAKTQQKSSKKAKKDKKAEKKVKKKSKKKAKAAQDTTSQN